MRSVPSRDSPYPAHSITTTFDRTRAQHRVSCKILVPPHFFSPSGVPPTPPSSSRIACLSPSHHRVRHHHRTAHVPVGHLQPNHHLRHCAYDLSFTSLSSPCPFHPLILLPSQLLHTPKIDPALKVCSSPEAAMDSSLGRCQDIALHILAVPHLS